MFNPGYDQLKEIADSAGIPLIVCLHPDQKELETKLYNEQGQGIIQWCRLRNVKNVKKMDEGIMKNMYRVVYILM